MAKQSGIHQLRGKVGEHSYYRQTGVSTGLVRAINQGMSARVKTGEEYVNTRLNNVEFGGACNVAANLGKMVVPKFRPMVLPFSQSKMAKAVLELAKNAGGNWGERVVPADSYEQLAAILSSMSKRDFAEFVTIDQTFDTTTKDLSATYSYTGEQASLMSSLGISKLVLNAYIYHLETGKYDAETNKIRRCVLGRRFTESLDYSITAGEGDSGDLIKNQRITPGFTPLPPSGFNEEYIAVYVVMPVRTINSVDHVLQEYCSFKAIGFAYSE